MPGRERGVEPLGLKARPFQLPRTAKRSRGISRGRTFLSATFLLALAAASVPARATQGASLDAGFRLLYETRFDEARCQFLTWEHANPQDPLGYAWEAASYLFQEFYHQGVLTSEFFLDDNRLLGGVEGEPNDEHRTGFFAAATTARNLARQRLMANPQDPEALFALTITTGMLADYAALIDKQQLQSLKLIREAQAYAKNLLAVRPDSADAYVALGAANYIVGSLSFHKRAFLWFAGIHGDRRLGMKEIAITAEDGNYLRPFAKILLALAAVREGQVELARAQLRELNAEFPGNPVFARELAKLKNPAS